MKTIKFPVEIFPTDKKVFKIQEGVYWVKLILPSMISHVNAYILDDTDGITIVDTGLSCNSCINSWRYILRNDFKNRDVKRVIVTHHHPDHMGLMGWFKENFNTEVWTSRSSWLTGRMLTLDYKKVVSKESLNFWVSSGMSSELLEKKRIEKPFNFGDFVKKIPLGYRRIVEDEELMIGNKKWFVKLTDGHAPEQVILFCPDLKIFISADQLLPGISPNISVYPTEPTADPLSEYLKSCDKLLKVKDLDYLVLPGHNLPFYGLNIRIKQIVDHHKSALKRIEEYIDKNPKSAYDIFPALFKRKIKDSEMVLALGESVAHLNYLFNNGIIKREINEKGVNLFVK
ncbi:MAG: MBL fold metallo-hydrolase [Paracoccaceae bacterium]